jgi:hypothetical protein
MEDMNMRIAVVFGEHANRIATHIDHSRHMPQYNLND